MTKILHTLDWMEPAMDTKSRGISQSLKSELRACILLATRERYGKMSVSDSEGETLTFFKCPLSMVNEKIKSESKFFLCNMLLNSAIW